MRRDVAGVRRVAGGKRHARVQGEEKTQDLGGSGVVSSHRSAHFVSSLGREPKNESSEDAKLGGRIGKHWRAAASERRAAAVPDGAGARGRGLREAGLC